MACEVVFEDISDTITLPKFKPAQPSFLADRYSLNQ